MTFSVTPPGSIWRGSGSGGGVAFGSLPPATPLSSLRDGLVHMIITRAWQTDILQWRRLRLLTPGYSSFIPPGWESS